MRLVPPVLLILCSLSMPASTSAQQAPQRDPQAIAVLQQSLAAMGGVGPVQIQDSMTQATMSYPGNPGALPVTVTIKTKGSDRLRIDNFASGRTASVIHNRGRNLRSTSNGWRVEPSANSHHKRVEHLPGLLLAQELLRNDLSASYLGLETVGSQSVHHIRLWRVSALGNDLDANLTKNSELNIFVDSQTFLILKVSYTHLSEIDWRVGLPMETSYNDYRSIGGMLVPFNQRTVFNGNPLFEIHLTSIAFNVGLADAEFEGR